jgi:hypothetical protein
MVILLIVIVLLMAIIIPLLHPNLNEIAIIFKYHNVCISFWMLVVGLAISHLLRNMLSSV